MPGDGEQEQRPDLGLRPARAGSARCSSVEPTSDAARGANASPAGSTLRSATTSIASSATTRIGDLQEQRGPVDAPATRLATGPSMLAAASGSPGPAPRPAHRPVSISWTAPARSARQRCPRPGHRERAAPRTMSTGASARYWNVGSRDRVGHRRPDKVVNHSGLTCPTRPRRAPGRCCPMTVMRLARRMG